jgi:multiple antibiotic resistance protein
LLAKKACKAIVGVFVWKIQGWLQVIDTISIGLTLFLIMDPLGNIPIFMSTLEPIPPYRRRLVLIRELLISLALMLGFLWAGSFVLQLLKLSAEAVSISGGIILLIIAIRMIFPSRGGVIGEEKLDEEPFIVPLATPLIAGPSILATLVLLSENNPERNGEWTIALVGAWFCSSLIFLSSDFLFKVLGNKGLKALERLMGMLLISIAVQMLLDAFDSVF